MIRTALRQRRCGGEGRFLGLETKGRLSSPVISSGPHSASLGEIGLVDFLSVPQSSLSRPFHGGRNGYAVTARRSSATHILFHNILWFWGLQELPGLGDTSDPGPIRAHGGVPSSGAVREDVSPELA